MLYPLNKNVVFTMINRLKYFITFINRIYKKKMVENNEDLDNCLTI